MGFQTWNLWTSSHSWRNKNERKQSRAIIAKKFCFLQEVTEKTEQQETAIEKCTANEVAN